MAIESSNNILTWLDELRFCTESYEPFARPLSGGTELALLFRKTSSVNQSLRTSLEIENKPNCAESMSPYQKLWECSSHESDKVNNVSEEVKNNEKIEHNSSELKHADVCRVSVVFQDCEEVADTIEPAHVENVEFYLSRDVLDWITGLWYSSEEEDVEEFEEFEKYQQSRVEDRPTTPKFPVVQEPVQLRKSNSLKPSRSNSRSNTIHVVQTPSSDQNTQHDIQISAPLKLIWRGGKVETIDRGAVVYKNGLLQIQNDTIKSKVEMKMNSTIKNNKICEFSSPDQSLRVSVEREHQITMGSPRQRRKSVEEESPKNFNKQNILMKLLRRRSDKLLLERKGIFKCEDIFGNKLTVLHESTHCVIPEFVKKAVELIESEKNIKSEHIYRLSGNMATIQKIRLKIDGKNYKVLDDYRADVDVLTGCLKLFYRELVEPLIPYKAFEDLHKVASKQPSADRDKSVKSILKKMETPHKENLLYLIQHLLTVESYKQFNKMTVQNLSIVWGPSMLWYPGAEKCTAYSPYEFSMLVNGVLELILTTYQTDPDMIHQIQAKNGSREDEFRDIDTLSEDSYKKSPSVSSTSSKWLFGLRKAESRDKLSGSTWSLTETKKDKPSSDGYFGRPLESLIKFENSNIPKIIVHMVDAIEKQPHTKGLYCKPSSRDPVGKFKKKMQKNKVDMSKMDPLDVAIVLLKFLQELERPLIHGTIYEDFKENYANNANHSQIIDFVKEDIANLTQEHQETVEKLVNHVLFIFDHQDKESQENIYNAWLPIFSNSTEINSYNVKFMEAILEIYQTKKDLPTSILPLKKDFDFKFHTRQSTNSMDGSYVSDCDRMGISRSNSVNDGDNVFDEAQSIITEESRTTKENLNTTEYNIRRISNKEEDRRNLDTKDLNKFEPNLRGRPPNVDTSELASKLKSLMNDSKKDSEIPIEVKDAENTVSFVDRKNSIERQLQKEGDPFEVTKRNVSIENNRKDDDLSKIPEKPSPWLKVRESLNKTHLPNKDNNRNRNNKNDFNEPPRLTEKPSIRTRTQSPSPANVKRTFKDGDRPIIGMKTISSPLNSRKLINRVESSAKDVDIKIPKVKLKSNTPSPSSGRKYGDKDGTTNTKTNASPVPARRMINKSNLSTKNDEKPPTKPKIIISSPSSSRKNINRTETFDKSDKSSSDIAKDDDTKKTENKPNLFAKNVNAAADNKRIELSKVHFNALNKIIGAQSLENVKARTEMAYKKT